MSLLALALILVSAGLHATWNLFSKRVGRGASFIWMFDGIALLTYLPLAAITFTFSGQGRSWPVLALVVASGCLHLGYFLALQRGYRSGDLSLVYPLARGTGPLLATAGAVLLLGERPAPVGLLGGLLVVAGALILGVDPARLRSRAALTAAGYALVTGLFIAGYTLTDKTGVATSKVAPVAFFWGGTCVRWLLLTPWAALHRGEVSEIWARHARATVGIAILSPLAYILVLIALTFTAVSYVAPAREVGILFGTWFGLRLLDEPGTRRRLAASAVMMAGVFLLALPG